MKLWQKFALLGVLGGVMCAVPLVQLVQYKNAELAVAVAETAGLDPVRNAVALQAQRAGPPGPERAGASG